MLVVLAVAPLASAPGLASTDLPGVSIAEQFSGRAFLCEYLALTRLVTAITRLRRRPVTIGIGAVVVLAAPFSLINPEGFYSALVKPSLVALWVSQLIVFAVYPLFARRQRWRVLPAWTLAVTASALTVYGLVTALQQTTS